MDVSCAVDCERRRGLRYAEKEKENSAEQRRSVENLQKMGTRGAVAVAVAELYAVAWVCGLRLVSYYKD
jgi:hypothetical protein